MDAQLNEHVELAQEALALVLGTAAKASRSGVAFVAFQAINRLREAASAESLDAWLDPELEWLIGKGVRAGYRSVREELQADAEAWRSVFAGQESGCKRPGRREPYAREKNKARPPADVEIADHEDIKRYLRDLQWDGKQRIDVLFPLGFRAFMVPPGAAIAEHWMVAAVARVLGQHKFRRVGLRLIAPQGAGKSRALMALFGDNWFEVSAYPVLGEGVPFRRLSSWCVEIQDMPDGVAHASLGPETSAPVCVATTCAHTVRRGQDDWVSLACADPDIEWLNANRDQLWAEAVELYRVPSRYLDR